MPSFHLPDLTFASALSLVCQVQKDRESLKKAQWKPICRIILLSGAAKGGAN